MLYSHDSLQLEAEASPVGNTVWHSICGQRFSPSLRRGGRRGGGEARHLRDTRVLERLADDLPRVGAITIVKPIYVDEEFTGIINLEVL
jgi:hypothetical protein